MYSLSLNSFHHILFLLRSFSHLFKMLFFGLQSFFPILKSCLFDVSFNILLSIIYYLYAFAFNFCPLKCTNSKELDKIGEILNDVSICIVFVSSGEGPVSSRAVFFQAKFRSIGALKSIFEWIQAYWKRFFRIPAFIEPIMPWSSFWQLVFSHAPYFFILVSVFSFNHLSSAKKSHLAVPSKFFIQW